MGAGECFQPLADLSRPAQNVRCEGVLARGGGALESSCKVSAIFSGSKPLRPPTVVPTALGEFFFFFPMRVPAASHQPHTIGKRVTQGKGPAHVAVFRKTFCPAFLLQTPSKHRIVRNKLVRSHTQDIDWAFEVARAGQIAFYGAASSLDHGSIDLWARPPHLNRRPIKAGGARVVV